MKAPAFWSRPPGLAARLLAPAGLLYGTATARRMRRAGTRAPVPVVCVGNVTAGGSGKTPTALALAAMLIALGERPVFLTRGYGGSARGPLLVDLALHDWEEVGDEPLLLARAAPTVVARDRVAGAQVCASLGATVVVMDDGLQNPSLAKDLSFAVFDGGSGVGNGYCLPAGPLRAPLDAQWPLINAAILIGKGEPGKRASEKAEGEGKPILLATLEPDAGAALALRGGRMLAFAGIGRPQKFFETLEACGATVERRISFADHHAYTRRELVQVLDEAVSAGLVPITTEKDRVRLSRLAAVEPRVATVASLPVRLAFSEPAKVQAMLDEALRLRRREEG